MQRYRVTGRYGKTGIIEATSPQDAAVLFSRLNNHTRCGLPAVEAIKMPTVLDDDSDWKCLNANGQMVGIYSVDPINP